MKERIKLIKPYITFEEISSELEEVFNSGQLTKGPHVAKFIKSLTDYTGSSYAIPMTSATTALTMCLKVLGIKKGDKVAISDFSFPATANVVEDVEATPIFIDVDKNTYNMCVEDLRSKLDDKVKAVIFVDALGNPSGIDEIKSVCEEFGIPLIEDSACAIGSSVNGVKVGSIADLTCFSFHPRKLLTTGEGGAILTNNHEYASWLEMKANHGASGLRGKVFDFVDFGYNYRMSEIQALMGWKQIVKLDDITGRRNLIAKKYAQGLQPLGMKRQEATEGIYHNIQSLVFTVPETIKRDDLIEYLAEHNIESTLGTYCMSGTTFYSKKYNTIQPIAQWLENHTITLPCYDGVDLQRVISVITSFFYLNRKK
ncbi:DegT/DnrJ/EryC1/StrS family aminotransferase [Marinomonas hwangdonensis]|uniref:DegT/DnrJ/EryC1/StrS family aminotransferase n=1 Tax=Marinomonas hwangdonensis TaxID=1053647 RepID=A0A3M8PYA9_9GAMM|nr:DegT/DnrJ/EryC1/StrS family aminotransferase [Marinomonas hwangdonensis]RNF48796.1 DegT/DnrJ/EryC1/StrS family aminotransferase [Marinomonas hwangdonensis]